jgi:hypothetical protein
MRAVALASVFTSVLTVVLAHCAPDEFATTDAGSDASPPVDGAFLDAVGPDASVLPPDAGFAFTDPCTTPHKLCCDFDDAALDKCWASLSASNATVDLADAAAVSPPLSMHALAQGDASYGYGRALLGGGQSVVCTFDLYIDKLIGNDHNLGQIVVNGDDNHGFSIVSSPITPDAALRPGARGHPDLLDPITRSAFPNLDAPPDEQRVPRLGHRNGDLHSALARRGRGHRLSHRRHLQLGLRLPGGRALRVHGKRGGLRRQRGVRHEALRFHEGTRRDQKSRAREPSRSLRA